MVDKHLQNDDYERIIAGYKVFTVQLAKAQPTTRQSQLFAQIKHDLDAKVADVQKHILEKLVQFPSNPDDQKLLIDYYNALDIYNPKTSQIIPAWYCLEEEKKWLIQLMISCRDMHIADEKVSLALKQSNNDESSSSSMPSSNKKNDNKDQINDKSNEASKIQAMTQVPHERNKFIEELCEMFFDIFTDYWKLGSMYLNNLQTSASNNKKSAQKRDTHTSDDYYALVSEILTTFSNIVRAAFIPHTFNQQANNDKINNNLLLAWPIQHDAQIISQILPHCLRVCRCDDFKFTRIITIWIC